MVVASQQSPRVSIGVPVFNGEPFVADALASLLAQTFRDFELIIADNASTDRTESICQAFARHDPRIRYIRHARNLGAPENWNYVARAARGAYFKWASANDYCTPTMLTESIAALDADPRLVLCYGRTRLIDAAGLETLFDGDIGVEDERPSERFLRVLSELSMNNAQCGLIRREVLMKTGLDRSYPGGDMVLMAELALYGRFKLLPDVHLYRRTGKGSMTARLSGLDLARIFQPDASTAYRTPTTRRHLDYLTTALCSSIPLREKMPATIGALRRAVWGRAKIWHELRSLLSV